jgi:hypothetical protein
MTLRRESTLSFAIPLTRTWFVLRFSERAIGLALVRG